MALFLLASLLIFTVFTTFSAADEDHCLSLLPYSAMQRLRFGLDITTVDVFPLKDKQKVKTTSKFQTPPPPPPHHSSPPPLPLLAPFTCANASRRWGPNPQGASGGPLADQIRELHFYSPTATTSTLQSYRTSDDYLNTLQSAVQLQDEVGVMAASASTLSSLKTFWSERTIVRMITVAAEIRLHLDAPFDASDHLGTLLPSEEFKQAVDKLKGKQYSAETQKEFFELIANFGTHLYQEHTYGKYIVQEMAVEDRYYKAFGAKKVENIMIQYRAYLANASQGNSEARPPPIDNDPDFIEEARPQITFTFDGFTGKSGYNQVLVHLRDPITIVEVLDEAAFDAELIKQISLAVNDYLAKAELRLLVATLSSIAKWKEVSWILAASPLFDFRRIITLAEEMISTAGVRLEADVVDGLKEEAEKFIRFAESCKIDNEIENIVD